MITRNNFDDVLRLISVKDISRLKNTDKEYCVLNIDGYGQVVTMQLSNDYNKHKNVSNNGGCILETTDVLNNLNRLNIVDDLLHTTVRGY